VAAFSVTTFSFTDFIHLGEYRFANLLSLIKSESLKDFKTPGLIRLLLIPLSIFVSKNELAFVGFLKTSDFLALW